MGSLRTGEHGCIRAARLDANAASAYNAVMAILKIRDLPDNVHARLRVRAARHGRSMEAEAREILAAACGGLEGHVSTEDLQSLVDDLYRGQTPGGVVDELIRERRREAASE